jgi:hypothetical protein
LILISVISFSFFLFCLVLFDYWLFYLDASLWRFFFDFVVFLSDFYSLNCSSLSFGCF